MLSFANRPHIMRSSMSTSNPTRKRQMEMNTHLQEHRIATNCGNCEWRSENLCTKFDATPPIQVVVVGCEAWSEAIPF
jgi:hypothetical protein